jgi:hypothetical protein
MGEGRTGGDRRNRRRLTVPEAATVLGVTVDAVRGRIRRGKLASEHDEHGTVYVFIDAEEADRPGPSATSQGPSATGEGPSPDEGRLVDALEDRISSLERQLEAERAANRENRRLLAAALERIPAIEAAPEPRDEPETSRQDAGGVEDRGERAEPQTGAQEARRPWWLRWMSG